MHFFVKYFLLFLFFSSLGWLIESLYCSIGPVVSGKKDHFEFINRGFLSGPITPIYGVSCLVMLATLLPFQNSLLAIFFVGLLVCDVVEYITSFLMEKLFNARWWDYTGYFLNIKGRICFRNSLLWGGLSLAFLKLIYPGVNWLFQFLLTHVGWEWVIGITFLLLGIFLVDLERTVMATLSIRDLQKKARALRDSVLSAGDRLEERSDELRSSLRQMAGWQRGQVRRLLHVYPQFASYFKTLQEDIGDRVPPKELLSTLRFLRMDLDAFFDNEKREMY